MLKPSNRSAPPQSPKSKTDISLAMLSEPSTGLSNTSASSPNSTINKGLNPGNRTPDNNQDFTRGLKLYELAQKAEASNDLINARTQYNQALILGLPEAERHAAQERLIKLADQLIFSPHRPKGDPLVTNYIVHSGDTLLKIAKEHKVSPELLARINQLANMNKIRAGQNLKVIKGPFHAEIYKNTYDMFVYLQDTFVRRYKVGLGEEGSTPSGVWIIKTKLKNPTYYPPRGGQIILADDPKNPLGEHWLGLQGIEGEAVGHERYGIHGTIEPETIGKNVSLGCVRMYNDDIEWVYDMLVEKHSRVFIID